MIFPHLAPMPDAHLGKGATVGSVIPTLGAIIPAAVGVDIGCGMIAVRTQFTAGDMPAGPQCSARAIERCVPAHRRHGQRDAHRHRRGQGRELGGCGGGRLRSGGLRDELGAAARHSGSGNHFIEVTARRDRPGVAVPAFRFARGGQPDRAASHRGRPGACRKRWIQLPDRDLAYLVEGDGGVRGLHGGAALGAALRAAQPRGDDGPGRREFGRGSGAAVDRQEEINCHHNYTDREHHYGQDVWLSRKGAIDARGGRPGLIPGSMGTASYVVVGKGYPAVAELGPHGAGREHSRTRGPEDLHRRPATRGWRASSSGTPDAFIDEHPGRLQAHRRVMADAADLVEVRHMLRQLINVKGD